MHVSPITVNMSYMHTYLRDAWPYTFCVPKSAAVWTFYCLCSTNWDQRLCKTSLGNTRSEVFTIQKAKIQIRTTAVWIGVLDLFVLNCSDLLSLTDTWNSEIPAQLMTGMWTLPARQTWAKWPIHRALGFAGGRAIPCHFLPQSLTPFLYVHQSNNWLSVLVEDGEVPPFCQVQVFL